MRKFRWIIGAAAASLISSCTVTQRTLPVIMAPPPSYYQEALRAYWNESNSTAFVLAALAVEKDPEPQHSEHAAYLVGVLTSEKLSGAELKDALSDIRISHLMLDLYARGLGALKTNDAPLAFQAFRDFTLSTPSESWRGIGLASAIPVGWGRRPLPGEIDQNLQLAELALKLAPDPALAGQIAETVVGQQTKAQKIRAAQIMTGVYERTGDLSWAEKAFNRCLETQQFARSEELAQSIFTNKSATVSAYVSVGSAYGRAGQLERSEEVLTTARQKFGDRYAELTLAQVELYRRQHRYDDALNELLKAGREVEQFRREHYHPIWAKQIECVALATGPNDSVYAVTGETKPRVLHLDRSGEVLAQYGPFDDPTDDGAHPFAVFNDGTFLIRNRRWSSDGRMLQEFPFSSSAHAVCVDRSQRVVAFDSTQGITILSADAKVITNLCRGGSGWTPCYNLCPCSSIAANEESIVLVTRSGPMRLNYQGGYSGPWYGGGIHDVAAGRDDLFYLSGVDQVRVARLAQSYTLQPLESIPCGGAAIAAATSGGFYVGGIRTERGVWLVKFAPPFQPAE